MEVKEKARFFQFFSDLKLRNKLILSFFTLIILPLGGYFYLSSEQLYKQFLNRTSFSVERNFDQSFSFLSFKFQQIRTASDILISEKMLTDVMTSEGSTDDFFIQYRNFLDLKPFLSSLEDHSNIQSVKLFVNEELFYSEENINLFSLEKARQTYWFKRLMESGKGILWAPNSYFTDPEANEDNFLAVLRPFRNPNDYSEFLGVIRLDIPVSMVTDILVNAAPIRNSLTYIQDSNGENVASSNRSLQQKYKIDKDQVIRSSKKEPHFVKLENSEVYLQSKLIPGTDWYMVTVIPLKEIAAESKAMLKNSVLLLIVIGLIALLLSILISNYMTSRLTQIMRKMRNVQEGNVVVLSLPSSRDEFGELIENYNYMVRKIGILLEEQFRSGQEIKSAELKALQAQINPHFLYNTLDLMKWMARSGMTDEIGQVVTSLSKFYKLSLSGGNTVISIRDELLHVSSYMHIQSARYASKIQLDIQVDEEIMEYGIIKITLQPIVENAIIHGILCTTEEAGTIQIRGGLIKGDIEIVVSDDGEGMSPDILSKWLTNDLNNRTRGSGYGLRNINDRIHHFYGSGYGLTFNSKLGVGTTVVIRIPTQKL
ncbi:sensor histidine kinase [Paenibacillus sp. UASWS1643]|uniref:sensor histidine kinase n=1 Tax=Paenibacillus sp. UASWS1643 TaxID=2580422 RepID=UPI001238ACCC|nr:sensor histidine kinase [Paenibacillus sp. UASWS1643]KAA8745394.1 sensor histidine kinase [Paenibacillus sp. UASWS1643]